jgi:signal transduction histidine kinase
MGGECLSDALASSRTLVDMVSSLLDVSKMEAGQLELHRVGCDLAALCGAAVKTVADASGRNDVAIEAPRAPVVVEADRELVLRVLQNLIGNAVRFAPEGGKVRVGMIAEPGAVRVSVQDNGRGIAPEHHALIFEKFGQVRSDGPRVGTGLGLTFCKLAVEAHGGRIGVDSQEGKGATFWFELPKADGARG